MAIYHCSIRIISRGKGRNSVSAAAYRSGSKFVCTKTDSVTGEINELVFDYRSKTGVVYNNIFAPANAPAWVFDRNKLWQKVEDSEVRVNSRLSREFEIALPVELTEEQNILLVEEFAKNSLVARGMIADVNMHYDNPENPHAHIMTVTRMLEKLDNGEVVLGHKNRDWNKKEMLQSIRLEFAEITNRHLALHGFDTRVSHLSHKDLGIDLIPTIHEGPARYIESAELAAKNHQIKLANAKLIAQYPELVIDRLSINKPVFTEEDISRALAKALTIGVSATGGNVNNTEIRNSKEFLQSYAKLMESNKLTSVIDKDLSGNSLYTKTSRLQLEKQYIDKVQQLANSNNHSLELSESDLEHFSFSERVADKFKQARSNLSQKVGFESSYKPAISLNNEQKQAIMKILGGPDISILEGVPGAGKTTAMCEIARQYKKAGYKVIGIAQSSNAALQLATAAGIEAKNSTMWRKNWLEANNKKFKLPLRTSYAQEELYQNNKPQISNKHVMIIDEASMGELTNMDYLLGEASKAGAKVILVGDNNQFAPVGMAGALQKAVSICGSEKLEETRRQVKTEHRKATKLLSNFKVREALAIYASNDSIVISDSILERDNKLVRDYIDSYLQKSGDSGSSQRREDSEGDKKAKDNLATSKSIVVCTYTNESAQRLNKKLREQLKQAGIIKGKTRTVNIAGKTLELCRGEQVVFARNLNYAGRSGIYNGKVGTVLSVSVVDDLGNAKIKLLVSKSDGRKEKITIDTRTFNNKGNRDNKESKINDSNNDHKQILDYGYAVTAYKLQGATVDQTLALYEKQVGYEAFNVMMTRHRHDVKLYADRKTLIDNIYGRLDQNVDKARHHYQFKEDGDDLALIGLNISINKRANSSFAHDYMEIALKGEDMLIKEYLTVNKKTIDLIREINKQPEFTRTKEKRNELASKIVNNYDLYKDRLIQLNINYATLEKQSLGNINNYQINERQSKLYQLSEHYSNLIAAIESVNKRKALSSHKQLNLEILENKLNLTIAEDKLEKLKMNQLEIRESISNEQYHRQKLLPEYLTRIYQNPAQEVINSWQDLAKHNGDFMAAEMVTKNPSLLGKLKGIGFSKWIGFNDKRIDAIANSENIGKRLRQYDASESLEINLKSQLANKNNGYKKSKDLLEHEIDKLTSLLPSRIDQEFIDQCNNLDLDLKKIATSEIFGQIKLQYLQKQYDLESKAELKQQTNHHITKQLPPNKVGSYNNQILFSEIKSALTSFNIESIFRDYAHAINPDGKIIKKGNNIGCGSLNMDLKLGIWNRFSTDQKGDIFAFVREATSCNIKESLEIVASTVGITSNELKSDAITHSKQLQTDHTKQTIKKAEKNVPQVSIDEWVPYDKVPNTAEKFDYNKYLKFMKKKFEIQAIYPYLNNKSELLGYTVRLINKLDGKKQVLPITYCYNEVRKQNRWQLKSFADNGYKPIYGVEQLGTRQNNGNYNKNTSGTILLVEGEKTVDSAKKLLPEYTVLSWLGGVAAIDKVNWKLLQDRSVVIWPDNDDAGKKAAKNINSMLNKINGYNGRVSIVDTDKLNLPDKWDLADQLPDNLQKGKVQQIITDTIKQTQDKNKTLLKQWQNQLSSKDAINYMEYAIAHGKDEYEHEFLTLKDGLYRDTLVIIAANADLKPKFEQETSSIKENLRKIQDLYRKKIDQYEEHTISNRNLSNLSELEQNLIRDIIILHQQTLQTNDLANCHKAKIVSTVKDIVKAYKSGLKNQDQTLQISDKQKITCNLYKSITDKTWWKALDKAKTFEKVQLQVINSINKEIRHFKQYGFVKRDGIRFTSNISYLKHLKNDKQLGPYLKNTDFMTQLDRVKQRDFVKQTRTMDNKKAA